MLYETETNLNTLNTLNSLPLIPMRNFFDEDNDSVEDEKAPNDDLTFFP